MKVLSKERVLLGHFLQNNNKSNKYIPLTPCFKNSVSTIRFVLYGRREKGIL